MISAAPEFSRLVPLWRIGPDPYRQQIAATDAERAALARRFDLLALDRLTAAVELVRQSHGVILLRAAFEAEYVQTCVVTLDPIGGAVRESFALRYGPPELEKEDGLVGVEEVAFEPLLGEAIDVGEAVAQEFSLVLPAFPRNPDAAIETEPPHEEASPFAVLARLAADRQRR